MSDRNGRIPVSSMTLAEQVALELRVPTSGTDWLDEAIMTALRVEFEKLQYSIQFGRLAPSWDLGKVLDYEQFIEAALNPQPEEENGE